MNCIFDALAPMHYSDSHLGSGWCPYLSLRSGIRVVMAALCHDLAMSAGLLLVINVQISNEYDCGGVHSYALGQFKIATSKSCWIHLFSIDSWCKRGQWSAVIGPSLKIRVFCPVPIICWQRNNWHQLWLTFAYRFPGYDSVLNVYMN